jgi:hypothetical protein
MKGRELVERAANRPDQRKILLKAFDDAWEVIAADVDSPEAIEANRLKLANLILNLADDGCNDAVWLTDTAIWIIRTALGKG